MSPFDVNLAESSNGDNERMSSNDDVVHLSSNDDITGDRQAHRARALASQLRIQSSSVTPGMRV